MELQEFVKKVLVDLVSAVDDASETSTRAIGLASAGDTRTVEFDIAVTIEAKSGRDGSAGIKVFQLIEGGGRVNSESKNQTVSRIKFGVLVSELKKGQRYN